MSFYNDNGVLTKEVEVYADQAIKLTDYISNYVYGIGDYTFPAYGITAVRDIYGKSHDINFSPLTYWTIANL